MEIKEAINKLVDVNKVKINAYSILCEVVSVEVPFADCKPLDGSALFNSVKLNAGNDKNYIVPKVGSTVIVSMLDKNNAYISMFSEIDKIYLNSNEIIFNDGSLGGLIKINELTQKINELVTNYNQLVSFFNAHVHAGTVLVGSVPLPVTIVPTLTTASVTPIFNKADFENIKIKH
jgi:hypothetical protein